MVTEVFVDANTDYKNKQEIKPVVEQQKGRQAV